MARSILIFIFILLKTKSVYSSSCCGGSPISFHLPKNNQSISLNLSYSQVNAIGRVFSESENFIEWTSKNRTLDVLSLSSAYMLGDRLSLGLQSSFLFSRYSDDFGNSEDQNWGDSLISLNYEALPEYTYSKYKPKIFTSILINTPTGRSIFEEDVLPEGANVTGHGLWGLGLGLSLYKTWSLYSLSLQTRGIQILSGRINNQRISNYLDFSTTLRFSRQLYSKFALSLGLSWSYISKRERTFFEINEENQKALSSQRTTTLFGVNYSLNNSSILSFTYSDESLLGQPRNTLINRTLAFNLNHTFN